MSGTIVYVSLGILLFLGALALGLAFEPVDPRSRRSGVGIVRERWHAPQAVFADAIYGMGGMVHIAPESWWVAVEIEGVLIETSVRRNFFDAVQVGTSVRVAYSRTRFTKWLCIEEMEVIDVEAAS